MCEPLNKKIKIDNSTTASKTLKGIFRRDEFDDSLSTSDWGLLEEEPYKFRKRNLSVKLDKEPLTLICEWNSCYQDYSDFNSYYKHLKEHWNEFEGLNTEGTFGCCWTECIYVAHSVLDLIQHVSYHGYHTKLRSVGKNVEIRSGLPSCSNREKFVIPVVPDGYHCEWQYCYEKFNTIIDFFDHLRVHVFHSPKGPKEGVINCSWKGCTHKGNFASQYKFAEHLRMHSQEKIIACRSCGHLFSNKTKFCDHIRRQLSIDKQSYLCSQCSKYFPSERLLRDHMRLHINHYKCSMCEMTCPKPSILAKHIRYKHLSEKPYKCSQCDFTCVAKHNLDFHLKKHETESLYKCSDCDYKCRSAFGLENHNQRTHKKGKRNIYECHNCNKQFIRGGLLTKHMMKIHNYHWPSGHSRFRYKKDQDGIYRLQTVRYETLDVTEEIMKGKTVQAPSQDENVKVKVSQRYQSEDYVAMFDIVLTKDSPVKTEPANTVVITINDVDSKGNLVKSETIQSDEVICVEKPVRRSKRIKKQLL